MILGQYGSIKTLLLCLQQAPTLQGVTVVFGEENINAQDIATPAVCVVPVGGPYQAPGYIRNNNVEMEMLWGVRESMDLYCWDFAPSQNAEPIDHVDATENLRSRVLQALQYQRPRGVMFYPASEKWALMKGQQSRYGRALVMSVAVDISVPGALPTEVTLQSVELQPTIED